MGRSLALFRGNRMTSALVRGNGNARSPVPFFRFTFAPLRLCVRFFFSVSSTQLLHLGLLRPISRTLATHRVSILCHLSLVFLLAMFVGLIRDLVILM